MKELNIKKFGYNEEYMFYVSTTDGKVFYFSDPATKDDLRNILLKFNNGYDMIDKTNLSLI
jgi:hypothetical protein